MLIILVKRYHLGTEKVMYTQDKELRGKKLWKTTVKVVSFTKERFLVK